MYSITFHCKVITPMFISGANQQQAELRAPSIKGALRFWWRAMRADLAQQSLRELREREGEIFGDTLRRAGVILQTEYSKQNYKNYAKSSWTDFNSRNIKDEDKGLGYLLYSKTMMRPQEAAHFSPGFPFVVTMLSNEKKYLIEAVKAFWLFTFLGGIGTRSRRGAGAFEVIQIDDSEKVLTAAGLQFVTNQEKNITEFFEKQIAAIGINQTNYNNYSHLYGATIKFSNNGQNNWKSALRIIGNKFSAFRFQIRNIDLWQPAAFGLPILHRDKSKDKSQGNTVVKPNFKDNGDRRASPIIIQVFCYQNKIYWITTFLNGAFLPDNGKMDRLVASNRKKESEYGNENMNIIEKFLSTLPINQTNTLIIQ